MKTAKKIRLYDLLILGALTSASLLSSCQKKLDTEFSASDGMLRFEVSDTMQWQEGHAASKTSDFADTVTTQVRKIGDVWEDGQQMYLHASVESQGSTMSHSEMDTKGTVINSGTFHNSFGIYAALYSGSPSGTFSPTFMNNVKATGDATGNPTTTSTTFQTASKYYIPYGKTVKMYAVAPYNAAGVSLAEGPFNDGRPSYKVTTQQYLGDQPDICFAEATAASGSAGNTTLNFEHAMAAIRFFVAADVPACHINSITINGVRSTGTVKPVAGQGGWWTANDSPKINVMYNNGGNGIAHDGRNQTDIFRSGNALFLIPQTLGSDATLSINVTSSSGAQRTLTTSLNNTNWTKGKRYIYTLSFTPEDPTTFQITTGGSGVSWSNGVGTVTEPGGTYTFNIQSKKGTTKLPYKVEYSTNGTSGWTELPGNSNTLLIGQSSSVDNNNGTYTHTFKVYQQYTINSTQNTTLKNAAEKPGIAGRTYRLDVDESGRTATSNCYIVTAPGSYAFTTAYGNSIVANNTISSSVLNRYKDYKGNFIQSHKMNGSSAQVLWSDVPNLVTNVSVTGTELSFQVPRETIQEGNAVIGLLDASGICMWSWHIWVTPQSFTTQTVKNVGNNKTEQQVLMRPVGYVNSGTANWRNATLYVRFVQSNGSGGYNTTNIKQYTIKQTGATGVNTPGRYPVYQWGRKDPLWPMAATKDGLSQDAPVYPGPSGKTNFMPTLEIISGSPGVRDLIRNPHKPYGERFVESLFNSTTLWDANANTNDIVNNYNTVKTIYDPSPMGFKVAPPGTFDAIAHNDYNYLGSIATPVEPLTPRGGYGRGKSTALNYTVVDPVSKIIYCRLSGGSNTLPIPLLGGRFYNDNMRPSGVSTNFYTWQTSRRKAVGYLQGCSLGIYATDYDCWVDLYGQSYQQTGSAYAGYDQQNMANAFPILPVADGNSQQKRN